MNKRSKKPPVTPAEGPCPEGLKAFDVTVVETFNHHYIVYARNERAAEALVEEKCNNEEFNPSTECDSEFDRSIDAEETELRVVDLKPDGHFTWRRRKYPYWILRKDGDERKVSTLNLQRMLFRDEDLMEYESDAARRLDEQIAFFVGTGDFDTVDSVMEEVFR